MFGVWSLNVNELVKRVEDALDVLGLVVGDLADLRDALKGLVKEYGSAQEVTVEAVRGMIPEKLREPLFFSEDDDYVIVTVHRRLRLEAFKAVVDIVIGRLGGEYVSLGGGSGYFRIPKRARGHAFRS
jgi:hypothetical protein